jgi:hypothetical protein
MSLLVTLLAALPLIFWPHGLETAPALKQAEIQRIAAPLDKAEAWRGAGVEVVPMSEAELQARERLAVPRIAGRANVASPTRRPWVDANGWRFIRQPAGKFYYDLPAGRAAFAAAEAFAYGADAVLKIDPSDLEATGKMLLFLGKLPPNEMPPMADIGVVDDGSPLVGEVMNLLSRRNLLFQPVKTPSPKLKLNIQLGTNEFPKEEAENPSDFAQKVRRRLTDERRTLRIYGSETVIARLTSDGRGVRLHLLNYNGREIEGLRIRLRGIYAKGEAFVAGMGRAAIEDYAAAGGATEFTVAKMNSYAVIDLPTLP